MLTSLALPRPRCNPRDRAVDVLDSVEFLRIDRPSPCPDPERRIGRLDPDADRAAERDMTVREFFYHNARTWLVRPRPEVRKDEAATHVTLELVSDDEVRVVTCLREEWETPEPDLAALLARSVATGASRASVRPSEPTPLGD
jgi:hypothetical protein